MSEELHTAAAHEEGIRKLESMLGGTRMHAARALKEMHERMLADLVDAQHRARRSERRLAKSRARTQQVRLELQKARQRARKAERRARRLAAQRREAAVLARAGRPARPSRLRRLVRRLRDRGA
jgi:DNA repair exonuclease SbcCD ATPase subunit